jgi:hypothetical protein
VEYEKAIERIQHEDGWRRGVGSHGSYKPNLEALTPTEWTLVAFEVAAFVDETGERYRRDGRPGEWLERGRACRNAKNYQTIPSRKEALDIQTAQSWRS